LEFLGETVEKKDGIEEIREMVELHDRKEYRRGVGALLKDLCKKIPG